MEAALLSTCKCNSYRGGATSTFEVTGAGVGRFRDRNEKVRLKEEACGLGLSRTGDGGLKIYHATAFH